MKIPRHVLAIVTLVLSTAVATACQQQSSTNSAQTPVRSVGESLYIQSCARCHGAFLEGNPGTGTPAIDAVRLAGLSDQMLAIVIANGKGQMPAFGGLTTVQVSAIINYMRYRQ